MALFNSYVKLPEGIPVTRMEDGALVWINPIQLTVLGFIPVLGLNHCPDWTTGYNTPLLQNGRDLQE